MDKIEEILASLPPGASVHALDLRDRVHPDNPDLRIVEARTADDVVVATLGVVQQDLFSPFVGGVMLMLDVMRKHGGKQDIVVPEWEAFAAGVKAAQTFISAQVAEAQNAAGGKTGMVGVIPHRNGEPVGVGIPDPQPTKH